MKMNIAVMALLAGSASTSTQILAPELEAMLADKIDVPAFNPEGEFHQQVHNLKTSLQYAIALTADYPG